ncbi:MAG: hypothetical protein L0Y71_22820 [Gemmataceae bacterium]|nr:hypothetical protein [Gemmataceae bacterium]
MNLLFIPMIVSAAIVGVFVAVALVGLAMALDGGSRAAGKTLFKAAGSACISGLTFAWFGGFIVLFAVSPISEQWAILGFWASGPVGVVVGLLFSLRGLLAKGGRGATESPNSPE